MIFLLGRIHSRPGPHAARGLDKPGLDNVVSLASHNFIELNGLLRG
jgi:hypothetical protein